MIVLLTAGGDVDGGLGEARYVMEEAVVRGRRDVVGGG